MKNKSFNFDAILFEDTSHKMENDKSMYSDSKANILPFNQQLHHFKKYEPYSFTRYRNVVLGENGIAKILVKENQHCKLIDSNKELPTLYENLEDCCGCTACYTVCIKNESFDEQYSIPHGAISMEIDDEGFKYPVIDAELCVRCYKCIEVCPIKNTPYIAAKINK